jgi:hypothetical protein
VESSIFNCNNTTQYREQRERVEKRIEKRKREKQSVHEENKSKKVV